MLRRAKLWDGSEAPAIQMRIHDLLTGLYGEKIAEATAARIFTLAARFSSAKPPRRCS